MSLKTSLQWYWDLSSADASIVDQHSGLSLSRIGTTTTDSTGGPDGGPCIQFANAGGGGGGKYQASVAKTVSYDDGYTVNVWIRTTGQVGTFFDTVIQHRNASGVFYFMTVVRNRYTAEGFVTGNDYVLGMSAASFRLVPAAEHPLNAWQMLTLRDTGGATEIWRNGSLVATVTASIGTRSTAAANFTIGGEWNNSLNPQFNHRGQLAMAGVWNEPLDAADITRLYNGGMGRRYADLGGGGIIPILQQHYAAMGAR